MGFVDDFSNLMGDTATYALWQSDDDFGTPTFGTASDPVAARVVRKPRVVRTAKGDTEVSSHQAYLAATVALSPVDRVTLSDGSTPPILSVDQPEDETGGIAYTRVNFR